MKRRQYYPHSYNKDEIRSLLNHDGLYKTKTVTVSMPVDDVTKLKLIADYRKATLSNVVNELTNQLFDQVKTDKSFQSFVAQMMNMSKQTLESKQLSYELEKRILNE